MALNELPLSLRMFLKAEARRRNVEAEVLLAEILAGGNPLPEHISDLIREVYKARNKLIGGAERQFSGLFLLIFPGDRGGR
jgi:hypothetical protein